MAKTEVTDAEIRRRIRLAKYQVDATFPPSEAREAEIALMDDDGHSYRLHIRNQTPTDFHVEILSEFDGKWRALVRYDSYGGHLVRSDKGGDKRIYGFHIHRLTREFYEAHLRDTSYRPDGYAEVTEAYKDLRTAWEFARQAASIHLNPESETAFFYRTW